MSPRQRPTNQVEHLEICRRQIQLFLVVTNVSAEEVTLQHVCPIKAGRWKPRELTAHPDGQDLELRPPPLPAWPSFLSGDDRSIETDGRLEEGRPAARSHSAALQTRTTRRGRRFRLGRGSARYLFNILEAAWQEGINKNFTLQ